MNSGGYQWDFSVVFKNWNALGQGLVVTLIITSCAIIIGSLVGALIAWAKGHRTFPVRAFANAFTDVFRALPVLVTMIWLFYSFPSITLYLGFTSAVRLDPEVVSIMALSVYLAAQLADILRAGMDSIPTGQYDVARTLGLSSWQIVRYIQAPQTLRLTLPAILGQYASTLLLSSLASVIAVGELLHQAQNVITNQYHALEIYTTVALLYLAVALPLTILTKRLSRRPSIAVNRQNNLGTIKIAIPRRSPSLALDVQGLGLESESARAILDGVSFKLTRARCLGSLGRAAQESQVSYGCSLTSHSLHVAAALGIRTPVRLLGDGLAMFLRG